LLYPILFWNNVVYLPNEHYCYVSFGNSCGIVWIMFNAYGIPLLVLLFIYFCITIFVHQQSNDQIFRIKQRQKRDLVVIRRILMNIGLLFILRFPSLILLLILITNGEEHPLIFRISLVSGSVSMTRSSVSTILSTSKFKSIFFREITNESSVNYQWCLNGVQSNHVCWH
jgi:predicted tellurium resistance membrane protein TerC